MRCYFVRHDADTIEPLRHDFLPRVKERYAAAATRLAHTARSAPYYAISTIQR